MVLLVDYTKQKAGSIDTPATAATSSTSSRVCEHLLCQPGACHHPEDPYRYEINRDQIEAAQAAGAQEEPDRVVEDTVAPLTNSSSRRPRRRNQKLTDDERMPKSYSPTSRNPSNKKFLKRCETSELVREHRNRRPTVLTENEASHAAGMDMDLSSSNATLFSHNQVQAVHPKSSSGDDDVDWSKPSRRTVSKQSTNNTAIRKPTTIQRSVSARASLIQRDMDTSLGDWKEQNEPKINDANSTQSRGCVSLSNLYSNNNYPNPDGRLSFTLRRPHRDSSARSINSMSSVSRFEQSLSILDVASLDDSHQSTPVAAQICPHTQKSQLKGCATCTKQQSIPKPKTSRSRSDSYAIINNTSRSTSVPARIKCDMGASFSSKKQSKPKPKLPKNTPRNASLSPKRRSPTKNTDKQRPKSSSLSPKRSNQKDTFQKMNVKDHKLDTVQNNLLEASSHERQPSRSPRLHKSDFPSSYDLGYADGEEPIPGPIPLTVQISSGFQAMTSTDALPGNVSDDESLSEDEEEDDDRAPVYAPQYSPKRSTTKPRRRRCTSMNHQLPSLQTNTRNNISPSSRRKAVQRSSSLGLNSSGALANHNFHASLNMANRRGSMTSGKNSQNSSSKSSSKSKRRMVGTTAGALDMNSGFVTGSRIRRIDHKAPKLSKR